MDLNLLWFVLLGVLLAGYAILDGFDLGVGILHLAARNDKERRLMINSIGPLWDGNEVWLVTFGGAMFAAFPNAYATVFSGFYAAFMLLLFALIFRAVSMEFRSKRDSQAWKRFWDYSFFGASLLATFLFGVAAGNALIGMPVDARGYFTGSFFDLVRPYPILIGLLTVSFAIMHGAIYLYLKTEEELQQLVHRWMWRGFGLTLIMLYAGDNFHSCDHAGCDPQFPRSSVVMDHRRPDGSGFCQHPPRDFPGTPFLCFHFFVADDSGPGFSVQLLTLSQPGCLEHFARLQPDDLQCRLISEDAGHHGDYRPDRDALCACLYDLRSIGHFEARSGLRSTAIRSSSRESRQMQ